ncbi:hypothetical protein OKW12_001201 [Pseudomonas silensiensis]|nr:hypothetical protein [Pseudomonas silensiensis]
MILVRGKANLGLIKLVELRYPLAYGSSTFGSCALSLFLAI